MTDDRSSGQTVDRRSNPELPAKTSWQHLHGLDPLLLDALLVEKTFLLVMVIPAMLVGRFLHFRRSHVDRFMFTGAQKRGSASESTHGVLAEM